MRIFSIFFPRNYPTLPPPTCFDYASAVILNASVVILYASIVILNGETKFSFFAAKKMILEVRLGKNLGFDQLYLLS